MSDQPGVESIEDGATGSYSVDDGVDAGMGQDELLDTEEGDNEPWSPPDLQPRGTEYGTTVEEQRQGESLEQRIQQEVPDPGTAYGAPDNEGGLDPEPRVGGDDPDSIDASQDFLGDAEVGDGAVGQLADPDEGTREDHEPELLGEELGSERDQSAEEQAMHVVEGD